MPQQTASGLHEDQLTELTRRTAAQIDSVLQSAATLAMVLVNEAIEPGISRDFNTVLMEALVHYPAIVAIELTDTGGKIVGLAHRAGTTIPMMAEFSELPPRREWEGVTLLHADEELHGQGLIGLRARAGFTPNPSLISGALAAERRERYQVIVFLRGRDLPGLGGLSGVSWVFGHGHKLVAEIDGVPDVDASDAMFRAWVGNAAHREYGHVQELKIGDTKHRVITSRLAFWPLTLVVDAGPVEPIGHVALWSLNGVMWLSCAAALVCGGLAVAAFCAALRQRSRRGVGVGVVESRHRVPEGDAVSRQFSAVVAHEFNNLLTTISFDAEMVAESRGGGAGLAVLSRSILAAARRGAELTEQLQAYSERAMLHPRLVDLSAEIALRRADLEASVALGQQLQFTTLALAEFGPHVWLDPNALVNRLLSLLRKMSEEAGPDAQIDLDVSTESRGGRQQVCVCLRSKFAPSDPQSAAGLYVDSAIQVPYSESGKASQRGTLGLSLAAATGFARQSGGWLEMEGAPGQWRCVRFVLPVQRHNALGTAPVDDSVPAATPPRSRERGVKPPLVAPDWPSSRIRVLIVDDCLEVREGMARHLRGIGYDVFEAQDAADAESWVARGVDVMVTDIVLHDAIDGWALATRVREHDPNLPLVFISGFLSARQAEVMATDELASFVRKPVEASELRAVIEGLLAMQESRRLTSQVD